MPHSDEHLTILVVRTGGFAGLRRAWRVLADGTAVETWTPLVEACPWDAAGSPAGDAPGTDRFCWEVTAARGETDRRAVLSETDAEGPWRTLIDRVRADGQPVPPHAA